MTENEAHQLIEAFQAATRAVAWAEAGGDEADHEDLKAAATAEATLLEALTRDIGKFFEQEKFPEPNPATINLWLT